MPRKTIDHEERARRAWPHLVARATRKDMPPLTYGELSKKIGVHHRAAQYYLGVIQTYCKEHRLPALQSLAVDKRKRLPGEGYVGSAWNHTAHQKELEKVRRKKWPPKAPF
jgi:hypothetical protein